MEQMELIFLVAVALVAFVVTLIGSKKLGQKVFNETGYNAFKFGHKFIGFLTYIPIALFVITGMAAAEGEDGLGALGIIGGIVVLALVAFGLVMLNRKAKKAGYIVGLTIFQILYGTLVPLVIVVRFTVGLLFRSAGAQMESGGKSNPFTVKVNENDYEAKMSAQDDIEAHNLGFKNADEARDAGHKIGGK